MAIDTERLEIQVDVDGDRESIRRLDRVEKKVDRVSDSVNEGGRAAKFFHGNSKLMGSGLLNINTNLKTSLYANAAALLGGIGVAAAGAVGPLAGIGVAAAASLGPIGALGAAVPAFALAFKQASGVVKLATKGMADAFKAAAEGGEAFQESLKELVPEQQAFVKSVVVFRPELEKMQKTLASNMFRGLSVEVGRLGRTYLPLVRDVLNETSTILNSVARQLASLALSPSFVGQMKLLGDLNNEVIRTVGDALDLYVKGFANLIPTIVPLVTAIADLVAQGGKWFATLTSSAEVQNNLTNFFIDAFELARKWGSAIWDLLVAFKNLMRVALPFGQILADLAAQGAAWVRELSESEKGIATMHAWFERAMDVGEMWGGILLDLAGILRSIFKAAQPAADAFLQTFGDLFSAADVFLKSFAGQDAMRKYFEGLVPVIEGFGVIFGQLAKGFGQILQEVDLMPFVEAIQGLIPHLVDFISYSADAFGPELINLLAEFVRLSVKLGEAGVWEMLVKMAVAMVGLANAVIEFVPFLDKIVALWASLGGAMVAVKIHDKITDFIGLTGRTRILKDTLGGLRGTVDGTNVSMGAKFGRAVRTFGKNLATSSGRAKMFSAALGGITQAFKFVGKMAMGLFANPIVLAIAAVVVAAILIIKHWDKVKAFLLGAWEVIKSVASSVFPFLKDLFLNFTPLGIIINNFDTIKNAFSAFAEFVKESLGKVVNWVQELPGKILSALSDAASWLIQTGKNILDGLWRGIVEGAQRVWRFYSELPGKVVSFFAAAGNWLVNAGRNILQGLLNGLRNMWESVRGWLSRIGSGVAGAVSGAASWLYNTGKDVVRGLWNGIKSMLGWLKGQITGFIKNAIPKPIRDFLKIGSPSKLMMSYGMEVARGLELGMRRGTKRVGSAARLMAKAAQVAPIAKSAFGDMRLPTQTFRPSGAILAATRAATGGDVYINVEGSVITERELFEKARSFLIKTKDRNVTAF